MVQQHIHYHIAELDFLVLELTQVFDLFLYQVFVPQHLRDSLVRAVLLENLWELAKDCLSELF